MTWTYVVTNTGDVDLTNVEVTDDIEGTICTIGDLAVGETDTCTATGVATLGQYANMGTVTGFYPAMARAARVDRIVASSVRMQPSEYAGGYAVGNLVMDALRAP